MAGDHLKLVCTMKTATAPRIDFTKQLRHNVSHHQLRPFYY